MRILEEMYYGNILPNITKIEENSEHGKQAAMCDEIERKLIAILEGKEKKLFLDFVNSQDNNSAVHSEKSFSLGFKFGALLMIELFCESDDILYE